MVCSSLPSRCPSTTRGLRTGCSACQDTTISEDASAPNCRCSPATGGVATGSGDGGDEGAAVASPAPIRGATIMVPPAMPAAAISRRRLSSRLNPLSGEVMAASYPQDRSEVGNGNVGKPPGVRNSISAPSFRASTVRDCRLLTTPLTCGDQASVAISIRMASHRSGRQSHQWLSHANDRTLLNRVAKGDARRCKYDDGRSVLKPSHFLPLAQ